MEDKCQHGFMKPKQTKKISLGELRVGFHQLDITAGSFNKKLKQRWLNDFMKVLT